MTATGPAIRILPPELVSQIAAGEVVERPASVVKELIENALDAGARDIRIVVRDAGRRLIEVADDGHGIPADQLPLAVARHATSKIRSAEDLFCILTLGFRGEALAAIASVSRLTIVSRPADEAVGARIRVEGGKAGAVQPVGAPPGTVVRVEDLFYNVPARRKFLKSDTTERRHIDALVTRYALAYPQVRFRLEQDGRLVLQTSGSGDRREVLAALYGPDLARRMLPVQEEDPTLTVTGFIGPPDLTRSHRRDMVFFVNGRPVHDAALTSALLKGYHTLLMVGRYPVAVLFLTLPPAAVDVNVHPTKAEVRFRDPDAVFRGVQRAVRKALLAHAPVPRWEDAHERHVAQPPGEDLPLENEPFPWGPSRPDPGAGAVSLGTGASPQGGTLNQAALPGKGLPLLRPLGQIAATYIVAEGPDGLYLIDQHAAHERVLFERLMAHREEEVPSQALLEPATVHLTPPQARLLEEQLPYLSRWGFTVEPFGPQTFRVRAVPVVLAGMDPAAALRALVEDFEEDETPLAQQTEARIIARVCKRAAVKAGQVLSPQEQEALVRDLEACQNPRTCPHGRPTMIHIPVDALERRFGRLGPR